jgi:DHH family/DHHA1 domain
MRIGRDKKNASVTPSVTTPSTVKVTQPSQTPEPVVFGSAPVPSGTVKPSPKAGLYDAPIPERRLPPLHEALENPAITPLSPAEHIDVPAETLDALRRARRVLVIGHVPPDGDCVGAALGLARALRGLGKEADACVDADLQGQLRGLPEGDLLRARDLEGPYDLVVVVDVAQGKRTGGALAFIAAAEHLLVVDHHVTDAGREELGASDSAQIDRFIRPDLNAACLQVSAIVERLAAESDKPDDVVWREAALPLCAGVLTDTQSFRMPGASMDGLRMFKHMAQRLNDTRVDEVEDALLWKLPPTAAERLRTGSGEGQVRHVHFRAPKADVIAAPKEALEAAHNAALRRDESILGSDIRGNLLDRLDESAAKHEVAVLVSETEAGVEVSVRSRDADLAVALVEQVFPGSGGGKPHVAAAKPQGDLQDAIERISTWLEARRAASELMLRRRR